MDFKQARAFDLASIYLEANHIPHDSFSLANRIIYWDKRYSDISALQLASLTIVNPPVNIYYSDSDIREFANKIFHQ